MPKLNKPLSGVAIIGSLLAAGLLNGAPAARAAGIELSTDSTVGMEGDSTLHRYHAFSKEFKLKLILSGKDTPTLRLGSVDLVIPVKTLKSGDGALDGNLYRAMEADKYPTIRFIANDCKLKVSGSDAEATAEGTLTIAGTEKPVMIRVLGTLANNKFHLTGHKDILMSDYGVKPPVIMFGAIKCADKITIKFDLTGEVQD